MTKEQLEVLLTSDNRWAGYSTLVLAIGILGEYVALPFFDKKTAGRRLYAGLKIAFAVMVVLGVFGEYRYSSRIADVAGQIQSESDSEVIQAQKDAREAQLQAKSASEGAAGAFNQARDAVAAAGAANKRASENEKEAARLNKLATDERLEILAVEERLLPRAVSAKQRDDLKEKAKDLQLGAVVIVKSDLFAGLEAKGYAGQITGALGNAGISAVLSQDDTANPLLSGIFACASGNASDEVKNASIKLRDLLKAAGFPRVNEPEQGLNLGITQRPHPCTTHDTDPKAIWLIVGSK